MRFLELAFRNGQERVLCGVRLYGTPFPDALRKLFSQLESNGNQNAENSVDDMQMEDIG